MLPPRHICVVLLPKKFVKRLSRLSPGGRVKRQKLAAAAFDYPRPYKVLDRFLRPCGDIRAVGEVGQCPAGIAAGQLTGLLQRIVQEREHLLTGDLPLRSEAVVAAAGGAKPFRGGQIACVVGVVGVREVVDGAFRPDQARMCA